MPHRRPVHTCPALTLAVWCLAAACIVLLSCGGAVAAAGDVLVFTVHPSDTVAGVAIAPSVQVEIQNGGITDPSANYAITLAFGNNPSSGALSGQKTVNAENGIATFGDLSINRSGSGYTLVASATGFTNITSNPFDISPADAAKLAFTGQPGSPLANVVFPSDIKVAIQDALGNTVTTAADSITIAIGTNAGGGTLAGTPTVSAVNGVATFNNLSIDKAGTGYTLSASSAPLASAISTSFNITYQLAFAVQPTNTTAALPITPAVQVEIKDGLNNTVGTAANAITVAIGTNPGNGTLSGTKTVNAESGIATFGDLSINKAGSGYKLSATATGLLSDTSTAFDINMGPASKLVVIVQPASALANAVITPALQVQVQDAEGNVINNASNSIAIAIGANPGAGTLSGTTTRNAVNGMATFGDLSIDKAGTGYTLSASSGILAGATSSSFNITYKLAFTVQPANTAAGQPITPAVQVEIKDGLNDTVATAGDSITVALGTNPGGGTLNGTRTLVASNGVAVFSALSIAKAAVGYTLTAAAAGMSTVTSTAFNISPGDAAMLAFTVQPISQLAHVVFSPAIKVGIEDAFGNTVPTATDSITIAIGTNPGGGTLAGALAVSAVNGVATFSDLSIDKTGTGYTLSASSVPLTGATSNSFNISIGPATRLGFTVQPANTPVGSVITPPVAVAVQDSAGNTIVTATNSITIALGANPGGATLSGTATRPAVNGVATFNNLSLDHSGSGYTLIATATSLAGSTSNAFDITYKLVVTVQPADTVAGVAIAPAVQIAVQDGAGGTITSATDPITVAIATNPGGGTLAGTLTVPAVNGVATFSDLSINKTGAGYRLGAGAAGIAPTLSDGFNITPGPASQLAFMALPPSAVANSAITPAVTVAVQDSFGNTVTTAGDSIIVALANNPPGATLSGATTVSAVNGVATFSDLSVNTLGTGFTLSATAAGLTGATSGAFDVTYKLAFMTQPSDTVAAGAITPAVQVAVQDGAGATITTAGDSITLALAFNPSGASLSGVTTVSAVNGVATFGGVSLDRAGAGYSLSATAPGLVAGVSAAFNVTYKLAFIVQPATAVSGSAITPAVLVTVCDALGNTVTSAATSVTVAIGTNPGGGTLSGTTTVAAVNGVATFSGLSIDELGTGYTLAAMAGALTGATSTAFDIASAGTVATPTFSPVAGTYSSTQLVTIATTTSGATIYYTTDGSTPTTLSAKYTGPIIVAPNTTISAYAHKAGMTDSAVATAMYTPPPEAHLTASPVNGFPPLIVSFSTDGTSAKGATLTERILDFGDGVRFTFPADLNVVTTTHTYTTAGTFVATLIVKDSQGGQGFASMAITVGESSPLVLRTLSFKAASAATGPSGAAGQSGSKDSFKLKGEIVLPADVDLSSSEITVGFVNADSGALGAFTETGVFQGPELGVQGGQFCATLGDTRKYADGIQKFSMKAVRKLGISPNTYALSCDGFHVSLYSALQSAIGDLSQPRVGKVLIVIRFETFTGGTLQYKKLAVVNVLAGKNTGVKLSRK